ncbi:hypothetical protein NE237_025282 [Protea cynaroides]|uniref:60S ribosomal protein L27 n=1 Tax=Protea cynaroides TaxID=273540 RepID=A0A9Q0K000_9MAGN|nr:hypothetical protein NE237_025282 [Protea cynaroides]
MDGRSALGALLNEPRWQIWFGSSSQRTRRRLGDSGPLLNANGMLPSEQGGGWSLLGFRNSQIPKEGDLQGFGEEDLLVKKSRVKAFIKLVNYNHFMPTRYTLNVSLKEVVSVDSLQSRDKKVTAAKETKALLEEKFKTRKNRWFFTKLRF